MSDSVRPHRRQPTRLPCPRDSPGQNTGVGCHFLLQGMKVKGKVKSLSRVRLLATPWTAAFQAPPSMGFSRQEYWSGVTLPSPFYYWDWNIKVGSQETPGVSGKFGLGMRNEAGQRLIVFCQENALVIANTLFQQHKRRLYI